MTEERLWHMIRGKVALAIALVLLALLLEAGSGFLTRPFSSVEVRFADSSPSGLAIVPASCPSNPHFSGGCTVSIPLCPDGTPVPASGVCPGGGGGGGGGTTTCPPGQALRNGQCVAITCPTGFTLVGSQCVGIQCPTGWALQGNTCVPPPPPQFVQFTGTRPDGSTFGATGGLQVIPSLVRSTDTTRVYWNAENVASCGVSGSNGDAWTGASSGSGGKQSSQIVAQTVYSLFCTALPGATPSSISETAVVNIIPTFEEL